MTISRVHFVGHHALYVCIEGLGFSILNELLQQSPIEKADFSAAVTQLCKDNKWKVVSDLFMGFSFARNCNYPDISLASLISSNYRSTELLRVLVSSGAPLRAPSTETKKGHKHQTEFSPLEVAYQVKDKDIVRYLLEKGVPLTLRDSENQNRSDNLLHTALAGALSKGKLFMTRLCMVHTYTHAHTYPCHSGMLPSQVMVIWLG